MELLSAVNKGEVNVSALGATRIAPRVFKNLLDRREGGVSLGEDGNENLRFSIDSMMEAHHSNWKELAGTKFELKAKDDLGQQFYLQIGNKVVNYDVNVDGQKKQALDYAHVFIFVRRGAFSSSWDSKDSTFEGCLGTILKYLIYIINSIASSFFGPFITREEENGYDKVFQNGFTAQCKMTCPDDSDVGKVLTDPSIGRNPIVEEPDEDLPKINLGK